MATINTNMSANIAANSMVRNDRTMTSTMERLSTGLRINSAKDDAAGLAISSKMTSQINGLNQAVRNANDAMSMIQVGEGALKEVTNMLQRMRELAIQASSDSNTIEDRTALNNEFTQLRDELSRISANTQWNGNAIFSQGATSSASKTFQIGANADQTIDVTFENFDAGTTDGNVAAKTGSAFVALDTDGGTSDDIVQVTSIAFATSASDADTYVADTIGDGFSLTDGTTTVTISTMAEAHDHDDDTSTTGEDVDTVAKLVDALQDLADYSKLSFTVSSETNGLGIVLTQKNPGVVGPIPNQLSTATNVFNHNLNFNGNVAAGAKNINALAITSQTGSNEAMYAMSDAINKVNAQRALLGASMSRLEFASDNLQNVAQNSSAARSRVLDADYASETTELARNQIIQQASTAMLSQANQAQQSVLALLK